MSDSERPLTISVEEGELVIRIGIRTLQHSAEQSEVLNPFDGTLNDWRRTWKITDCARFAEGVAHSLMDENPDDGSTVITRALDAGFIHAIENDYSVDEIKPSKKTATVKSAAKRGLR